MAYLFSMNRKKRTFSLFFIFFSFLVCIFFLYRAMQKPFVVLAPLGVFKTIPEERGGMYIPKNRKIYDELVRKKASPILSPHKKLKVILGIFDKEKLAQKALLRFISLAPDIFQHESLTVEKIEDTESEEGLYQVVSLLSESEKQVVCKMLEEQGGHCLED